MTNEREIVSGTEATCWRCGGTGNLTWTNYANGVCFVCHGTGQIEVGHAVERDGVHTFIVGDVVWQFAPRVEECDEYGGTIRYCRRGEKPNSGVTFQAFALGANRRTGITLIRCVVPVHVARKVWTAVKAGAAPATLDNAFLECEGVTAYNRGQGQPFYGWSAINRNQRGIELL